jgi:hypothetical protein
MNDAKTFAADLWNDLRARRLWPVAVLLVVALVATPVVLSKKAEEPAAPAPLPATPTQSDTSKGPQALAEVKLEDLTKGSGSSLSAFDESNPFAPPSKVLAAARREAQGDTGIDETTTDTGADPGATTDDGSTGGDGTPDTGDGDGGDDAPKTGEFTYVIDVTFWANGRRRTVEGLEKLDMLPNEAAPLLIFMGVTDNAGNAVFLVDSTLDTTGEGTCKPSRDDCAFLYLGAGSEQEFTNDDDASYRLRIDEIRKVKIGADSGSAASKASKQNGKTASAAVGGSPSSRRFAFPLITDLVVENSTDDQDRR